MNGYYLSEAFAGLSKPRDILNGLSQKHDVTSGMEWESRSVLRLGHSGALQEFPGNCSTLVLYNIQGCFFENKIRFVSFIDFSVELAKEFKYAQLIVSTTNQELIEFLRSNYGFSVILSDVVNPHSGNANYFLVKSTNEMEKE